MEALPRWAKRQRRALAACSTSCTPEPYAPATTLVLPIVCPAAEPLLPFITTDESLPSSGLINCALAARIADLRS